MWKSNDNAYFDYKIEFIKGSIVSFDMFAHIKTFQTFNVSEDTCLAVFNFYLSSLI